MYAGKPRPPRLDQIGSAKLRLSVLVILKIEPHHGVLLKVHFSRILASGWQIQVVVTLRGWVVFAHGVGFVHWRLQYPGCYHWCHLLHRIDSSDAHGAGGHEVCRRLRVLPEQ